MNRPFLLGLITYLVLAAALILLFLSFMGTARAESFTLHQEGAWVVEYQAPDSQTNVTWCEAANRNPDLGIMLQVVAWGSGNLSVALFDSNAVWNKEGRLNIRIDRLEPWEAISNSLGGQTLYIDNPNKEFLREFYSGKKIFFDVDRDMLWDYWFTLEGSAAALKALADCKDKLGAHPA